MHIRNCTLGSLNVANSAGKITKILQLKSRDSFSARFCLPEIFFIPFYQLRYIDTFFKLKTQASGLPEQFSSVDDYVEDIFLKEGIRLDREKIERNPAFRGVAKMCLNSLWGFFGQQENKVQTRVITDPAELHTILTCPMTEVTGLLPVNDDVLYLNSRYKYGKTEERLNTANAVIAAFVTAQARLKLYGYLETLDSAALYCDTDSIFFVSRDEFGAPDLETGPLLGDLTNELTEYGTNAYITFFISAGPKFYSYKVKKRRMARLRKHLK